MTFGDIPDLTGDGGEQLDLLAEWHMPDLCAQALFLPAPMVSAAGACCHPSSRGEAESDALNTAVAETFALRRSSTSTCTKQERTAKYAAQAKRLKSWPEHRLPVQKPGQSRYNCPRPPYACAAQGRRHRIGTCWAF